MASTSREALKLTLVIPVYNEEHHLKACLDAVARQTVMPFEVLVIDNNSTDNSVKIAQKFPFVRVVPEPVQGLIAARNRGFNEAKGDILGRIDADSRIKPNWVERVITCFTDKDIDGLTGVGATAVIPIRLPMHTTLWSRLYFFWAEANFAHKVMWGANMAVRKTAWQQAKARVSLKDNEVHEDQDLSSVILKNGGVIKYDTKMRILTEGLEYYSWPKLYEYTKRGLATKRKYKGALKTYPATKTRFKWWQRAWRLAAYIPFAVPFYGSSLILYALQQFFAKLDFKPPQQA